MTICYFAHHFWPTKNLSYPKPSFLPFKVKYSDHCRLEAIDSSVAGVSINMSKNIFFLTNNHCGSLPQNDMLRVTLEPLSSWLQGP